MSQVAPTTLRLYPHCALTPVSVHSIGPSRRNTITTTSPLHPLSGGTTHFPRGIDSPPLFLCWAFPAGTSASTRHSSQHYEISIASWIGKWQRRRSVAVTALPPRTWDEVVNRGVLFQRGLWAKDAWLQMVCQRWAVQHVLLEELREMTMPPTDEWLTGVWLNGMPEIHALRYMAMGVPSFVVHEYNPQDPYDIMRQDDAHQNLFLGSEQVHSFDPNCNTYAHIAQKQLAPLLEPQLQPPPCQKRGTPEQEQQLSSVHARLWRIDGPIPFPDDEKLQISLDQRSPMPDVPIDTPELPVPAVNVPPPSVAIVCTTAGSPSEGLTRHKLRLSRLQLFRLSWLQFPQPLDDRQASSRTLQGRDCSIGQGKQKLKLSFV
ncbi:hypothetical protein C8J57DRAFT_1496097 [Mycena rebaudengoi]|nr:hypothetical protein C8J57DRAFT_1496097 [Mycena rebaudengoi]